MFNRFFKCTSVPRHHSRSHRIARVRVALASILYWFRSESHCADTKTDQEKKRKHVKSKLRAGNRHNKCAHIDPDVASERDMAETIAWLDSLDMSSPQFATAAGPNSDRIVPYSSATNTGPGSDRNGREKVDRSWEADMQMFWARYSAIGNHTCMLGAYKSDEGRRGVEYWDEVRAINIEVDMLCAHEKKMRAPRHCGPGPLLSEKLRLSIDETPPSEALRSIRSPKHVAELRACRRQLVFD